MQLYEAAPSPHELWWAAMDIHRILYFKVFGPHVLTRLHWLPTFEWYMERLAVKNER